jgi:hypothetical protein
LLFLAVLTPSNAEPAIASNTIPPSIGCPPIGPLGAGVGGGGAKQFNDDDKVNITKTIKG